MRTFVVLLLGAAVLVLALRVVLAVRLRRAAASSTSAAATAGVDLGLDVRTPARSADPAGHRVDAALVAGSVLVEPCRRPDTLGMRLYARWVGVDRAKARTALAHRQQVPILACVGANGGGKTLCAVYTILPTLRGLRWDCANPDHVHVHGWDCAARQLLTSEPREVCDCKTTWEPEDATGRYRVVNLARGGAVSGWRRVLSTVALFDPASIEAGRPVLSQHYERLRSFVQLMGCEHAEVLMDEVTGIASARTSMSLPAQVENLIVQLRRRDARLIWTTPDYSAADVRIRQVTQAVVYARGFAEVEAAEAGRVWRQARMFRWSMYDARDFDAFTAGKREKLRPRSTQFIWRPGHLVQYAYDTEAAVTQLGASADGGMCMACGGSRPRPKCTCPSDPDRLPPGIVEEVSDSGVRRRRRVESTTAEVVDRATRDLPERSR